MSNKTREQVEEQLRQELGEIELGVVTEGLTLSQLMREGTRVTTQAIGSWGDGINNACALSAAELAAKARKLI